MGAKERLDTKDQSDAKDSPDFVSKAILMVDIVRFSLRVGESQAEAIRILILMLDLAIPAAHNDEAKRIWSPAGDGGALTFWDSIRAASDTAFSLTKLVNAYNEGKFTDKSNKKWPKPREAFQLRVALHLGPVISAQDFDGRRNIWGDGINMAARVLSLAKPGQILASETFVNNIRNSIKWPDGFVVECIGKLWAKHGTPIVPYNIYFAGDQVGISYSESEEWFALLRRPLEKAVESYESMASEEILSGKPFRAAILAKMILDLKPSNELALGVLRTISTASPGGLATGKRFDEFLSPLSYEAMLFFFKNAEFDLFEEGEEIAEEGESADFMMIVISGEIHPSKQGKRIIAENGQEDGSRYLTLRESDIIGEMGLFDAREERSATLTAYRETIVLRINYSCLQNAQSSLRSEDERNQQELRERIWRYYVERTRRNSINYNSLLQKLPEDKRIALLESDKSEFRPSHYQDEVTLSSREAWNSWIIVASGNITFHANNGKEGSLRYETGDSVGPMRLVMGGQIPFSEVKVASGTHLVILNRDAVLRLIQSYKEFKDACAAVGLEEKMKAGLLAIT